MPSLKRSSCCPSIWWRRWQCAEQDVGSCMGTAGVLPVEQPSSWPLCQLQRDGCLWGSTSQHCIFGLSSTSLWLLLIYLAWIITLSLRDAQLWSSMPSLENGRIRSSFLRGFLPDLSMHLADKRPFYPASLYIYLAVSSLVLYRCFPCSASPPSLLALAQVPWFFQFCFGSFVAAEIHMFLFITIDKVIFLSWVLQWHRD